MRSLLAMRIGAGMGVAFLLAAAAGASPWFPLEEGRESHFRLKRDRSVRVGEASPSRKQHFVGETVISVLPKRERVASEPDSGEVQVRVMDVERVPRLLGERRGVRRRERFGYSTSDGDVLLHLHTEESGTQEFDPPLLFLDGPLRPERQWEVGTVRSGGLRIDLTAEVMERGPVSSGERDFESALRIRFTGSVSGAMRIDSGEHEVEEGSYQRELWLVRGLGTVREIVEIDLDLRSTEGETVHVSDVLRRTLRSESSVGEAGDKASSGP